MLFRSAGSKLGLPAHAAYLEYTPQAAMLVNHKASEEAVSPCAREKAPAVPSTMNFPRQQLLCALCLQSCNSSWVHALTQSQEGDGDSMRCCTSTTRSCVRVLLKHSVPELECT